MAVNHADQYGLGEPLMLEKIDKLFACGVAELVDLPQIVVVGDQSSGKSSVLEGLIKKPLPRDSGLCTRFATQIVFRRAKEERISVSIIPDRQTSPDHATKVKAWTKDGLKELDSEAFSQIMREVHDVMGLSKDNDDTTPKPIFSNDVLRLEISGPSQEHLSVIDVPGIFKSTTAGQTTKDDIALVRSMVLGYMENPRSVMLAVIPANVDVATQEILELAHDVDPEGDRTLGVLTKPDLVDKGAELRVVNLVEGRTRSMKLGWHMVRNPGQQDLANSSLDRGSLETVFFRTQAPWKDIDKEKLGVESLRDRLKEVLSGLVKREFPKVQQEIRKRLLDAQKRLNDMGPDRKGAAAQMAFLTELATRFQRLVSLALSANHGADDVFDSLHALRIAPSVAGRMNDFSDDMALYGQTYAFLPPYGGMGDGDGEKTKSTAAVKEVCDSRKYEEVCLEELLHPQKRLGRPLKDSIRQWLLEIHRGNRGFELGTFNATILATAMKKQSTNWSDISLSFVSDIVVMVHLFITSALDAVCSHAGVRTGLFDVLSEGLMAKYSRALDHVRFLLKVESEGTPTTLNHYFNDNLQKARQGEVASKLKSSTVSTESGREFVPLHEVLRTHNMSNTDHVVQEVHDILKSYYKVTRKTFVDNVCKQASDHFLLNGDDSPLKYFSPVFVSKLSAEELESIAGEASGAKRVRSQLNKEITSLSEAKKILSRS